MKEPIDVVFLHEKEADFANQVFAFFPNEDYNNLGGLKQSYSHIGQHSGCHPNYAIECVPADADQYASLKSELESIGYKLNILNKSEIKT